MTRFARQQGGGAPPLNQAELQDGAAKVLHGTPEWRSGIRCADIAVQCCVGMLCFESAENAGKCAEEALLRRVDSAKPNPKGAQESARLAAMLAPHSPTLLFVPGVRLGR